MCSVQGLRAFVTERLTAAAAEILGAFEKTIAEYEEEIERQRRLLDAVWRPEVKLRRLGEPAQQTVCLEEDGLWIQERNSSLDQAGPEPPRVKQEELSTGPVEEVERLVLKEETDTFRSTPAFEESDHSEAEPGSGHLSLPVAGSREQERSQHADAEERPKKRRCKNRASHHTDSAASPGAAQGGPAFQCDFCAKTFRHKSNLNVHLRIHTGEEPYVCKTCGKRFRQISALKVHLNVHTGTVPFSCRTCGKGFTRSSNLLVHLRTHTGERPYSCETCGRGFTHKSNLLVHMRTHTGERPYRCTTCGTCFIYSNELTVHTREHTGEKPYTCNTCGEKFSGAKLLRNHMKVHTAVSQ